MKYYLAGPMTGIPQFNFPLFESATAKLRDKGYEIVSPAETDSHEVQAAAIASPDGALDEKGQVAGETWGDMLAKDVKLIADLVDGIVLLPNWQESKGARLEAFVAISCGHPTFEYHEKLSAKYQEHLQGCAHSYIMEKINESLF